ncbi:acyltransferase family protein [uncultured Bacteroides sp.]|uniref:acyltransferase family protein n=1 Tax=uncultured Bacteroides sp. TaxID=162156 RepID=UPI00266EED47|nr:acyltransferase family protein [uncultured Bacteroides sp.]
MAIQSITAGPRQSNFEILRMIAMFLVLLVHANFLSIGAPSSQDICDNFIPSETRLLFQTVSLYGVNVFILISGWFSIKASIKGLSYLLFQVYYFGIIILGALTVMGLEQITIGRLYQIVLLHKSGWFVISYVILYLLAPVLNKFSEYASKKEFTAVLLSYFAMLVVYGYIDWSQEIGRGYSALSMVGIYLLGRYARKYIKFSHGFLLFVGCTLVNTLITTLVIIFDLPLIVNSYDNPFVILGALGLILYFSNIHIKTSKPINYIARSTFAVYLLHIYPEVLDWFCEICKQLFTESTGPMCLIKMGAFLLFVYAISIILDGPRRLIWKYGLKTLEKN